MNSEIIKNLCKTHDTPLYIYSRGRIKNAVDKIKASFSDFNIIFSVKTNPFEPVLQYLHSLGVGIDAASANEALSAARIGHTDIYYSAPGKKISDLKKSLPFSQVIADSFNEINLINELGIQDNKRYEIGVRLNLPSPDMANSKFEIMGGTASKFGIDREIFNKKMQELSAYKGITITGLHVYLGSQLLDAQLIAVNFNAITQTAEAMRKIFPIQYINYGGGFGVCYEEHEQPLDLQTLSAKLKIPDGIRLNLELGRYLVAEAGLFVSTVVDIKEAGGTTYAIIDGGMNAFFRPKFTGQSHRVNVLGKENTPRSYMVKLVGNTCTPLDVFYEKINLPPLETGDIITFENAGAYGYSMSLLDFISFNKPRQVLLDD